MPTLSLDIDESTMKDLLFLSEQTERTVEDLHRTALTLFLEEERGHVQALLDGLREAEEGAVVTQQEVESWIGSLRTSHPLPRPRAKAVSARLAS